ncbi:MAG TPA: CYCXC family (seleno)protein [bacterium]|nr:CYCXC family (seleno)protein [bacterium]
MSKSSRERTPARARKSKASRWGWLAALIAIAVAAYVVGVPGLFGSSSSHGRSFHHMGGERRPVMEPLLFTQASARHAYMAAMQHPEVMDQVWCYCGCDGATLYHKSLLSCFTDYHGAGCDICQQEATTAGRLKDAGKSMEQIQDAIDARFG